MGDNYFKGQAETYRRRRDLAMEGGGISGLFARSDIIESEFDGKPWRDREYVTGETLWAVPSASAGDVALMRGSEKVGFVDGDGARALLTACARDGVPEVIPVVVGDVNALSGVAQLRLPKE